MKRNNLTFKTSIEDIRSSREVYTRADIGWSLVINSDDEGLLTTELNILHVTMYSNEPEYRLLLPTFQIDIVTDYCLCLDVELKPKSMSIDNVNRTLQINF